MSTELHHPNPSSEVLPSAPLEREETPRSEEPAVAEQQGPERRFSRRGLLRAGIGVGALGALAWLIFPRHQATLVPSGEQPTPLPSVGTTPTASSEPTTGTPAATATPPAGGASPTATPEPTAPPLGQTLLTYRGHTDTVTGLAWSPDGTRLASASTDQTVQIWDATSGKRHLTYSGHQGNWIWAVAWSPSGKQIASGAGDGTAQIWDATTGARVATWYGQDQVDVLCVAWSPDGTRLAAGDALNTVQVWRVSGGTRLLSYQHANGGGIYSVVWSPDGARVASAGKSSIQVWNPGTATRLRTWAPPGEATTDVLAWAPGPHLAAGPYLAVESASTRQITLWNDSTGQALQTIPAQVQLQVLCLAWSPDGRRLAWGGGNTEGIQVRSVAGASAESALKGKTVRSVAWSPDGRRLACGIGNTVLIVSA